jgi:putative ABC transport system permease protein
MISQVRNIMDKVILVIEAVFMFTLVAGVLVMIATMQSTHDERIRDNAIMKTLGASKSQLRKILFTEFFLIGAISSLIATLAANLISFAIATNLMNMQYQIHLSSVTTSIVIGTTLITSTGLMAFWRYHKMTPMWTLRQL